MFTQRDRGFIAAIAAQLPSNQEAAWDRCEKDLDLFGQLLEELVVCETNYRKMHDLHGDGSRQAGRAWDQMRRTSVRARKVLEDRGFKLEKDED